MKINKLSKYINDIKFISLSNEIYELTKVLNKIYPNYYNWFYNIQIIGVKNSNRDILFIENNNKIVSICSVKYSEKKICTLFTKEKFRRKGYASKLIDETIKILNTNKPLVTINENNLIYYQRFINKYNWELTNIKKDLYIQGKKEYFYNETFK